MLELGLLGGWAAGGPAAEAGNTAKSPAGAVDAADADVTALAGAFRELVDAFAGVRGAGIVQADSPSSASPAASPAAALANPETIRASEASPTDVSPAGSPWHRFMPRVDAAPAAPDDTRDHVEVPFALAGLSFVSPSIEPRVHVERTADTTSGTSTPDLERTSDDDLTAVPPMAPVAMVQPTAATPIDTPAMPASATSEKFATGPRVADSAPTIETPAGDGPRPAVRAESRARFARVADVSLPQSAPVTVVDAARVATSADSMPADVAATVAAMAVAQPGDGAVPATPSADLRKPLRTADRHTAVPRVSPAQIFRAAVFAQDAAGGEAGTNYEAAPDSGRESAMTFSRADLMRAAAPALGRDTVVRPEATPVMGAPALRLAAGLVAAGYSAGVQTRPTVSVATNGAPSVSTSPVITMPFLMPSMTASLAGIGTRATAPDLPLAAADVERTAPQIVQTIRLAFSRSGGEAHIRLDPQQFGDLSVSLRVEGGQVVARLQADAPAVREWLQTNQRTLQDQLAEHQLKLTRFEVVAPGEDAPDASGRHTREQQDDMQDRPARRPKRQTTGEGFEVVNSGGQQ